MKNEIYMSRQVDISVFFSDFSLSSYLQLGLSAVPIFAF